MLIRTVAIWNAEGDVRRIDLTAGLNIITGASQTGKSALLDIVQYCLGATELRVPAGPIADNVAYYGLLVEVGTTTAFLGRPALARNQRSTTVAQLEIGLTELPGPDQLASNSTTSALRDWIGSAIGIEENRWDPPSDATRPPLVARLSHALLHCFQKQDEIASRQILFDGQADPFVAQAIRDTLPYFLGVTGPAELRRAATLRELRRELSSTDRDIATAIAEQSQGLDEAAGLLSQAADAGLLKGDGRPDTLVGALAALSAVRDAPIPPSPSQPPGEEFDRLQLERGELIERLRTIREQQGLAAAIAQSGQAAEDEGVEQAVRLQPIGLIGESDSPSTCPVCGERPAQPPPAVEQLRTSLVHVEAKIAGVERDRSGLVAVDEQLSGLEREVRDQLTANTIALDNLSASAKAVEDHQGQLNVGAWVRGRIDHYLERAFLATDEKLDALTRAREVLSVRIDDLETDLNPARLRDAATSVLVAIGSRMTEMAQSLGLEHAESRVRVDIGRLTVIADTAKGPVYMNTGIGSAKNWVGYHLSTALSLQEHFVQQDRPVPRFLILDQPTQAFFPSDRPLEEVGDQDRQDALAQFALMRDVSLGLENALQIIVLDHADFDEDWFQEAVRERWRDGSALIPSSWLEGDQAEQ